MHRLELIIVNLTICGGMNLRQSSFYSSLYHWRKGKWPDAVNQVHIDFHSSHQERKPGGGSN